jgi:hypothetical protein
VRRESQVHKIDLSHLSSSQRDLLDGLPEDGGGYGNY